MREISKEDILILRLLVNTCRSNDVVKLLSKERFNDALSLSKKIESADRVIQKLSK